MYSLPSNVCVLVAQSCLTLCNPMYCSPPGTSAHGILWVRILEWVAIPFIVMYKDSSFSISSSALTILHNFFIAILVDMKWHLIVNLICISLMTSNAEHLLICFWLRAFFFFFWCGGRNVYSNFCPFEN